jgi:hypothetical protein
MSVVQIWLGTHAVSWILRWWRMHLKNFHTIGMGQACTCKRRVSLKNCLIWNRHDDLLTCYNKVSESHLNHLHKRIGEWKEKLPVKPERDSIFIWSSKQEHSSRPMLWANTFAQYTMNNWNNMISHDYFWMHLGTYKHRYCSVYKKIFWNIWEVYMSRVKWCPSRITVLDSWNIALYTCLWFVSLPTVAYTNKFVCGNLKNVPSTLTPS